MALQCADETTRGNVRRFLALQRPISPYGAPDVVDPEVPDILEVGVSAESEGNEHHLAGSIIARKTDGGKKQAYCTVSRVHLQSSHRS